MLLSDIVKIGKPIMESDMSTNDRIQLLTDVTKLEARNFYRHVFIVQMMDKQMKLQMHNFLQGEAGGNVDTGRASKIPITLPSGGNPLHAQGIYPMPCYPLYDRHINEFSDEKKTMKVVLDRLLRTVPYDSFAKEVLQKKATSIAQLLREEASKYVTKEKQLGVLVIIDNELPVYAYATESGDVIPAEQVQIVENIIHARFQEAKELGTEKDTVSTISNEKSMEVVSAYNKSWLWLSPTWEMPRSIYWKKDEWTRGIRLNKEEYAAYFYGSQFLKRVQTPLHASLLKEMFAPVHSVEAKKHMNPASFEQIYGIPYVLPLVDSHPAELYSTFQVLSQQHERNLSATDLQLEIITGLQRRILPEVHDSYRLSVIYYSGNLARGDIHIRAMLEDIVPSVAFKVQQILGKLRGRALRDTVRLLQLPENQYKYTEFKIRYLPSLLANAYGPGYLWSSLNAVLQRQPIQIKRVTKQVSRRLNELANRSEFWDVRNELLFYHMFRSFYGSYNKEILRKKEGVMLMTEWKTLLEKYLSGDLAEDDLNSTEKVGFITGCLLQQFERSYRAKTKKPFVETRVMRFGSQLTPTMIWKNGLLKSQELRNQWQLGIKGNYDHALSLTLPAIMALQHKQLLTREKDEFMTMFWSGYLMLPWQKKEDKENDGE